MEQKRKILITGEGQFDLTRYEWDDQLFSDILVKDNSIGTDEALDISRFLRKEIASMDKGTITMPVVDKIVQSRFLKYGLTKASPIYLDKAIFVKSQLSLSANAKNVLERRYLKKGFNML